MKKLTAIALLAVASALVPGASAQDTVGRIPTVTRLVKLFLEREDQLLAAMRARDVATLERTLTDDFEMRVAARPGIPIPRAEFIQQIGTETVAPYSIEQMAVHEIGTTMIVSFVLRPGAEARNARALFVIDTWTGGADTPHLRVRYVAPATVAPIPGAGAEQPQIPKKY